MNGDKYWLVKNTRIYVMDKRKNVVLVILFCWQSAVGFELWSMSPAILFDNILITDSMAVADEYAAATYDLKKRKIDADSVSICS